VKTTILLGMAVLLVASGVQAQNRWTLNGALTETYITGGPWTLEQSGAAVGLKSAHYCDALALGAPRGSVIWLVMKEVILLLAIGLAVGIPAAIFLGRYVSAQLYGVQASDPGIAAVTVILLSLVAGVAGMIPAHRASRIDPILALRYE
jgi:hypothetical protein